MPDSLVSSSIDMIYRLNAEGRFTYLNAVMVEFFDVKEPDFLGRSFHESVRNDYKERVFSFYQKQLEMRQKTTYFEVPIVTPVGKEYWLGQTVEAVFEGDKLLEFFVVARNITERVLATQGMLQSEQKYRSVIQNINLGLMEVDLNEVIVYANESFCDMMGYTLEELIGENASEVFLHRADPRQLETMKQAHASRETGAASAYEISINKKDGTPLWMIISGAPIMNPAGEVIGSVGIHNDITVRKQEELERLELLEELEQNYGLLSENENKLRAVIESALDAVITIDEKGHVLEWNHQATEIFGFKSEEALHQKLSKLIIPDQFAEAHDRGMEHFLKTGEGPVLHKRIEITGKHKKGHHFNVELSISPIKLKNTHIFSAFVRDITAKKKAEHDMEQALQKEKELAELRSRLISITSHEFRTPLTTIKSNVDLLQHKVEAGIVETSALQRNFDRVHNEIGRLNLIMNDILLLGRLESGKMPFQPHPIKLIDLINDVVDQNFNKEDRLLIAEKGNANTVSVDSNMYTHIIINLVNNALKYSSKKVKVEIEHTSHFTYLHVHDKGIGVPSHELSKMFESFFRASNAENRSGTGLGLALVKQFCDEHNIEIDVASTLNVGTTITLKHMVA